MTDALPDPIHPAAQGVPVEAAAPAWDASMPLRHDAETGHINARMAWLYWNDNRDAPSAVAQEYAEARVNAAVISLQSDALVQQTAEALAETASLREQVARLREAATKALDLCEHNPDPNVQDAYDVLESALAAEEGDRGQ